jgi:hypothetical protein
MHIDEEQVQRSADRVLERLRVFPDFRTDKDPHRTKEFKRAICRMVREFGTERVHIAVTRAIDEKRDWSPTPGQLRELVPESNQMPTRCQLCEANDGFVFVDTEGNVVTKLQEQNIGCRVRKCKHAAEEIKHVDHQARVS